MKLNVKTSGPLTTNLKTAGPLTRNARMKPAYKMTKINKLG